MEHPLLRNFNFTFAYIFSALLFISADIALSIYAFKIDIYDAVFLSIIFGFILFALGLSLWYPFLYLPKEKGASYVVVQFTLLALVYGAIWIGIALGISYLFHTIDLLSDEYRFYVIMRVISGILVYLLLLAIYFIFVNNSKLEEQNKQEMLLKNMLKQAELDLLKSQLNPHFLFNSLNSISSLTITAPDLAREMINKLSDFLRYSLRNNNEKLLNLKDEIANLIRYVDIEKVRFGDKIKFYHQIDEASENKLLPSLILQPLIENAIKYGVYDAIEAVKIEVKASNIQGDLHIIISNEYESVNAQAKGEGVGLNNIKQRLINIYNRSDLLSIADAENIFAVKLTIPQHLNNG